MMVAWRLAMARSNSEDSRSESRGACCVCVGLTDESLVRVKRLQAGQGCDAVGRGDEASPLGRASPLEPSGWVAPSAVSVSGTPPPSPPPREGA